MAGTSMVCKSSTPSAGTLTLNRPFDHPGFASRPVVACSCHILVNEQTISSGQQVLRAVVSELEHKFQINHTTVQVEVEGCGPNDMYCQIKRADQAHSHAHAGHQH